jgi:hypothetical protein
MTWHRERIGCAKLRDTLSEWAGKKARARDRQPWPLREEGLDVHPKV